MWNCTKRPSLVEIGRHVKKKTQDWVVNLGPFFINLGVGFRTHVLTRRLRPENANVLLVALKP